MKTTGYLQLTFNISVTFLYNEIKFYKRTSEWSSEIFGGSTFPYLTIDVSKIKDINIFEQEKSGTKKILTGAFFAGPIGAIGGLIDKTKDFYVSIKTDEQSHSILCKNYATALDFYNALDGDKYQKKLKQEQMLEYQQIDEYKNEVDDELILKDNEKILIKSKQDKSNEVRLKDLKRLLDLELITQEEYEIKRSKIIENL